MLLLPELFAQFVHSWKKFYYLNLILTVRGTNLDFLATSAISTSQSSHGIPRGQYDWLLLQNIQNLFGYKFLIHNNLVNKFREPLVTHHEVPFVALVVTPRILHPPFFCCDWLKNGLLFHWLWFTLLFLFHLAVFCVFCYFLVWFLLLLKSLELIKEKL